MAFDIKIEIGGLESTLQFLRQLPRRWQIISHDQLVRWGRKLKADAERLSPEDKLRGIDARRRPASERFKLQWQTEVDLISQGAELKVSNVDPKAHLVLFRTKSAGTITATGGPWPLRFYLPSGQMIKDWEVDHKGTEGQPVHEWALRQFDLNGNVSKLADALVRR